MSAFHPERSSIMAVGMNGCLCGDQGPDRAPVPLRLGLAAQAVRVDDNPDQPAYESQPGANDRHFS